MTNTQAERHGLSKSRLLLHRQCPKRLWLKVHRPELEEVNDGNLARFAPGTYVGKVAQQLYPDGVLVDVEDLWQAVANTQAILSGEKHPVFEATFQSNGLLIRADLLLPTENGFRMVEVKSSTSVKEYYLEDAAIQSWVAHQAKVPLASVEIARGCSTTPTSAIKLPSCKQKCLNGLTLREKPCPTTSLALLPELNAASRSHARFLAIARLRLKTLSATRLKFCQMALRWQPPCAQRDIPTCAMCRKNA